MTAGVKATGIAALIILLPALAACSGGKGNAADKDETYPEGRVRMKIEMLDTGLLKGHSYADAENGWAITAMKVEATDPKGARWPVIEPEFSGLGSKSATEFFEVTIQELPREEQISVIATATFTDQAGQAVDRTAVDNWPP